MKTQDLKKAGLTATVPRLTILSLLEAGKTRHMSAEGIYKALAETGEDVSLATIYRVLQQFTAAGLVSRLNLEVGHAVYEIADGSHHDHMCCVKCGKIEEFVDDVIESHQRDIAAKAGWTITDHTMVIYGLCSTCQ
ncbi:MAG: ferric iron uptake transcriptional regulator [Acidiferrobacterales bacterium]